MSSLARCNGCALIAALVVTSCLAPSSLEAASGDWLVAGPASPARVEDGAADGEIVLANGLVARTFRTAPNGATVGLDELVTGRSLVRAVKPEAELVINGMPIAVGGLVGQPDHAYLQPSWLDEMASDPLAFQLLEVYDASRAVAPFEWKRVRHAEDRPWPPPGQWLRFDYRLTREAADVHAAGDSALAEDLAALAVSVHYELYDGLPVFAKWITVTNGGERAVRIDRFKSEILAVVEAESMVDASKGQRLPDIDLVSDYAFGGMDPKSSMNTTHWLPDHEYQTQVNYQRDALMLVESAPEVGPGLDVAPGETFTSFRTYLLVHDSTDRERQGLAMRRMWRTIAPWVTENPLMMHVRHADPDTVRAAIDQCAEVGFEMVILTFGSGFDIENEDPAYRAQLNGLADYAHERGIELGGYSLLSSRKIGPETDVIDVETGEPGGARFGNAPCLGSEWGIEHMQRLRRFFEQTGFDLLEHDGSYPGDFCASTTHPGHRGYEDSQWTQWVAIRDFYRWCRARGISLNVPDCYFLAGSNKTAMGYRETNWSLPRAQQVIHGRQNIYDGTWTKTPSMGWMFVPLTEYHGGGAAATLEPLSEHLDVYEAHLANNLALGVQACYRGPRLFDTDATRDVVARWVDVFKRHRAILESDLLHLRRADGRDLDFMLHVNPRLDERALLVVFNPLDEPVTRTIDVPLEYAGLTTTTRVRERDGEPRELTLDRRFGVALDVEVPARGMSWFVFEEGSP